MSAKVVTFRVDGVWSKVCSMCKTIKPLVEFGPHRGATTGLQSGCHGCLAAKQARARRRDPEIVRREMKQREIRRRKSMGRVKEHLREHPCVDCGEGDPVVLEFDHVRGVKRGPISTMLGGCAWATIEAEIAKCEVRCANCHRRATARRAGWWSYIETEARGE